VKEQVVSTLYSKSHFLLRCIYAGFHTTANDLGTAYSCERTY